MTEPERDKKKKLLPGGLSESKSSTELVLNEEVAVTSKMGESGL